MYILHPDDAAEIPVKIWDLVTDDLPHMAVSLTLGLILRNPYVSLGVLAVHGIFHLTEPYRDSRGVGGPSGTTPISTASKRTSEFRKTFKAKSAHGFRKPKAVSARGKCPKGHYWSYKHKKCVKTKFR